MVAVQVVPEAALTPIERCQPPRFNFAASPENIALWQRVQQGLAGSAFGTPSIKGIKRQTGCAADADRDEEVSAHRLPYGTRPSAA